MTVQGGKRLQIQGHTVPPQRVLVIPHHKKCLLRGVFLCHSCSVPPAIFHLSVSSQLPAVSALAWVPGHLDVLWLSDPVLLTFSPDGSVLLLLSLPLGLCSGAPSNPKGPSRGAFL